MNVWFACSSIEYASVGWEPQECIWCPSQNRRGSEAHYRVIRNINEGDLVLVCPDRRMRGIAIAKNRAVITHDRPENGGDWSYSKAFLKVTLGEYQELNCDFALSSLIRTHRDSIIAEIVANRPKYYLFSWQAPGEFFPRGRLQLAQGRFVALATKFLLESLLVQIDAESRGIVVRLLQLHGLPIALPQHFQSMEPTDPEISGQQEEFDSEGYSEH